MNTMEKRILAFAALGKFIKGYLNGERNKEQQQLDELIDKCFIYNGWFNRPNVEKALAGISHLLEEKELRTFAGRIIEPTAPKVVAVIMAGNIPAVGFHDFMCVLLSGHRILIKHASDDALLIPFFAAWLGLNEPSLRGQMAWAEGKLEKFDAVIATGSDNSSRYFEHYFGKYPHIIRKNRSSIAILEGTESKEQLAALGNDVFDYFGLGCRNVSKVLVPKGYKLDTLFEGLYPFAGIMDNKKYANNYEYNRAVYLLNKEAFFDNNFLLIKYSTGFHSPVGVLFCEEYTEQKDLLSKISLLKNDLQCIVTEKEGVKNAIGFGQSQRPGIHDFADEVDTIAFLNNLH